MTNGEKYLFFNFSYYLDKTIPEANEGGKKTAATMFSISI